MGFGAGDEVEEGVGIGAESDAAVFGVGAGGVDLVGGDTLGFVEVVEDGEVVVDGGTEDVDDGRAGWIVAEGRKFGAEEGLTPTF